MKPLVTSKADRKDARDRKNPHMAEKHAKRRHEINSARPKQTWDGEKWVR